MRAVVVGAGGGPGRGARWLVAGALAATAVACSPSPRPPAPAQGLRVSIKSRIVSVVAISDAGLASAAASIGRYNRRSVVVFVRNGERVGWLTLRVVRAGRPA